MFLSVFVPNATGNDTTRGRSSARAATYADTLAAAAACGAGSTKGAKKQLKKVVRQLVQYSHRLRSRASRRKFDETIREPLAAAADAIQADARILKTDPGCTNVP